MRGQRTVFSWSFSYLKQFLLKKKKRERENRKTKLYSQIHAIVLGDCCANNILLHPLEISYPRSLFAYFLCIFNNRHYILAGFICIHFYILWFDCKVFVGKRIVLHNWVSWKCLFIIGDQRTFVSWKKKKIGRGLLWRQVTERGIQEVGESDFFNSPEWINNSRSRLPSA